jgi:hypothetical protein
MSVRQILASWDFGVAVAVFVATAAFAPAWVPDALVRDFYGAGIAVLSILFSVFFAALAIIMSSSDDDFVAFLEEEKGYTRIVGTFRFTLILLFAALLAALFLYAYTSVRLQAKVEYQSRWWSLIFGFLFLYALLAAFLAALDSVAYAKYRSRFISIRRLGGPGQNPSLTARPQSRNLPHC